MNLLPWRQQQRDQVLLKRKILLCVTIGLILLGWKFSAYWSRNFETQNHTVTKIQQTHLSAEQYPLQSLRYVGIIESPLSKWALISHDSEKIFHITVGDVLDHNNYQVQRIDWAGVSMKMLQSPYSIIIIRLQK